LTFELDVRFSFVGIFILTIIPLLSVKDRLHGIIQQAKPITRLKTGALKKKYCHWWPDSRSVYPATRSPEPWSSRPLRGYDPCRVVLKRRTNEKQPNNAGDYRAAIRAGQGDPLLGGQAAGLDGPGRAHASARRLREACRSRLTRKHARRGLPEDRKPCVAAAHASLNRSLDGLVVTSCHAYVLGYDDTPRPNRLLSCREAQGAPSEVVEVGDLSRRKSTCGGAVRDIFPDDDGGQ
jgi:hypothetical protein